MNSLVGDVMGSITIASKLMNLTTQEASKAAEGLGQVLSKCTTPEVQNCTPSVVQDCTPPVVQNCTTQYNNTITIQEGHAKEASPSKVKKLSEEVTNTEDYGDTISVENMNYFIIENWLLSCERVESDKGAKKAPLEP